MTSPSNLLVIVEVIEDRPIDLAYEMLGLAHKLVDESGGTVQACILGNDLDNLGEDLIAHGADEVYIVDAPVLAEYQADTWMPDLLEVINQVHPDGVMIGHTPLGSDLAPHLAFRLATTVVTGCTGVYVESGKLLLVRPCYGGNVHEVVSFRTLPAVFTVKPKCFEPRPARHNRSGKIVRLDSILDPASVRTKVRDVRRSIDEGAKLESAEIVVAGGGGMKGPQGFETAKRLADLLGGAVGASRVACDMGWCPPSYQVGLSGKTVAPELYLAFGISGAGQHMTGCANAKTIVAINTDPDAEIFRFSRYGIVGDCHQLMAALIDKIAAHQK